MEKIIYMSETGMEGKVQELQTSNPPEIKTGNVVRLENRGGSKPSRVMNPARAAWHEVVAGWKEGDTGNVVNLGEARSKKDAGQTVEGETERVVGMKELARQVSEEPDETGPENSIRLARRLAKDPQGSGLKVQAELRKFGTPVVGEDGTPAVDQGGNPVIKTGEQVLADGIKLFDDKGLDVAAIMKFFGHVDGLLQAPGDSELGHNVGSRMLKMLGLGLSGKMGEHLLGVVRKNSEQMRADLAALKAAGKEITGEDLGAVPDILKLLDGDKLTELMREATGGKAPDQIITGSEAISQAAVNDNGDGHEPTPPSGGVPSAPGAEGQGVAGGARTTGSDVGEVPPAPVGGDSRQGSIRGGSGGGENGVTASGGGEGGIPPAPGAGRQGGGGSENPDAIDHAGMSAADLEKLKRGIYTTITIMLLLIAIYIAAVGKEAAMMEFLAERTRAAK